MKLKRNLNHEKLFGTLGGPDHSVQWSFHTISEY